MKVYVHPAKEDWIVDRFVNEWNEDNKDITTTNPFESDIIWLLASWCWFDIAKFESLRSKKILTTIHHIAPEKFDESSIKNFLLRDKITTAYHVYNETTFSFISKFTKKPIHLIEYWANQKIWKKTGDKYFFRKKYQLPHNGYLIGTFQRDTEGKDLVSPKLEKGPDLFCDAIEKWWNNNKNIHVVLAGWRRQYVISRLSSAGIPFTYFEKPSQEVLNELYQTLDLYPVTSRCEGGPQALIECGLLNVPVVSRDVGVARQVLKESSISSDVTLAKPDIPLVENLKLPKGYSLYRDIFFRL
jgi:glycosyltransferase involved in cell wall biosynthesis